MQEHENVENLILKINRIILTKNILKFLRIIIKL